MRYRLLASYQGAPYEAGFGPTDSDVVLFAACPPPEELRFEPATGHWRKQVRLADVQNLVESRPVGVFRGEPCIVLDDLGDRLHIVFMGHDAIQAEQLGYWEIDRGVFELITPRQEVTDIVEQRLAFPARPDAPPQLSGGAAAAGQNGNMAAPPPAGFSPAGVPAPQSYLVGPADASGVAMPFIDEPPLPLEAAALRAATAARSDPTESATAETRPVQPQAPAPVAAPPGVVAAQPPTVPPGQAGPVQAGSEPPGAPAAQAATRNRQTQTQTRRGPAQGQAGRQSAAVIVAPQAVAEPPETHRSPFHDAQLPTTAPAHRPAGAFQDTAPAGPASHAFPVPAEPAPAGPGPAGPGPAAAAQTVAPRRRRAAKKRLPTQRIFSDLAAQAAIPSTAFAIGEDVEGAMCLVRTEEGFEVFNCAAGARHEVRVFAEEESAYFYLFGVLAAEAVRTGVLAPRES